MLFINHIKTERFTTQEINADLLLQLIVYICKSLSISFMRFEIYVYYFSEFLLLVSSSIVSSFFYLQLKIGSDNDFINMAINWQATIIIIKGANNSLSPLRQILDVDWSLPLLGQQNNELQIQMGLATSHNKFDTMSN